MKKYHFFILVFALAVLFFVYGTFASREAMKLSSIGLTILVFVTVALSRNWSRTEFLSERTQQMSMAVAAGNAFLFLVALLGVVFLWNVFVYPISNPDFAVFGSLFLSILLMRLFILQTITAYVGKPL